MRAKSRVRSSSRVVGEDVDVDRGVAEDEKVEEEGAEGPGGAAKTMPLLVMALESGFGAVGSVGWGGVLGGGSDRSSRICVVDVGWRLCIEG